MDGNKHTDMLERKRACTIVRVEIEEKEEEIECHMFLISAFLLKFISGITMKIPGECHSINGRK